MNDTPATGNKHIALRALPLAIWGIVVLVSACWQSSNWLDCFRPSPDCFYDFSQEWFSAKNYWSGRPIYSPQLEAMEIHTGRRPLREADMLPWNAHPPFAVVLALPFGLLSYPEASAAWNFTMLALFLVALVLAIRLRGPPYDVVTFLALSAALIWCYPLQSQTAQGQLNGLLVLLLILAWWGERRTWPAFSGICIGLAAAIKLVPAFLFLYWLAQGKWKVLVGGAVAFLAANGVAVALFGLEAYVRYISTVVPSLAGYRSSWGNVSLTGFWLKLFNPDSGEQVVPLAYVPWLADGLILGSQIVVLVLVGIRCRQATDEKDRDRALGLAIVGMLLVSPILWNHYFVLLLAPLAIWRPCDQTLSERIAWRVCLAILWVPFAWFLLLPMGPTAATIWNTQRYLLPPAKPWQTLSGLAIQTYALVGLFYLLWRPTIQGRAEAYSSEAAL